MGTVTLDRVLNRKTDLLVSGMTCNNCARHVTEALRSVPGVESAAVDLEHNSAQVRWKPDTEPELDPLLGALAEAGYPGRLKPDALEATGDSSRWSFQSLLSGWHFNVVAGTAMTAPLMLLEWGFSAGMERWYHWLSFALVLPFQILGGSRFYSGAWRQLKAGQSNMDTLVSLGSTTAFAFSVWGLFAGWREHLYFMDAAAILTLVSIGHFVEAKVSAHAASSLRALLQLAPERARRISHDGEEEVIPAADLRIDDRAVLLAGDRIATDGEVIDGASTVDESMLTGESMPVEKASGAKLFTGTINQNGRIIYRVTGTGEETALAEIIRVVQQAQSSRANIQRLGDRVSSVFVPIVVMIAFATALWWGLAPERAARLQSALAPWLWHSHFSGSPLAAAFYHAAAVLIIACPCAMGLATPVAIMAGTNAAARRGILIRDGAALEKTGTITAIVFDKTGTLTEGKVSVAAFESLTDDAPKIAATMARASSHPLSKAIARHDSGTMQFTRITEIPGHGLEAVDASGTYRLGSLKWLAESGATQYRDDRDDRAKTFIEKWSSTGATVTGLALNQELLGVVALRDSLKPHAAEVVERLGRTRKKIYLVTGDQRQTALAMAAVLGIPAGNVRAEVRPEGKAEIIRALQSSGERVAFVGDGINDAPALEQADLGIALMNASDVARESADIVLLKADVEAIPEALGLARATLRTIKQNLFWAFFYNALGVPLAALGFLSPVLGALAMGLSDLIVIGNAIKLRWWKLPHIAPDK